MSEDYLGQALERAEHGAAVRRAAEERAVESAMIPHPRDSELHGLLVNFAERMRDSLAIPFVEQHVIQDPPVRRFLKPITPPPRTESVERAHGWVLWRLGGRDVYMSQPPNAGVMGRLALGVTTQAKPMFILRFLPSRQLPVRSIESVRVGPFDFDKSDVTRSPLCARTLGPIVVENKCGAILETLRLHYYGKATEPGSASGQRSLAADQAKELLVAMGATMAEMLKN